MSKILVFDDNSKSFSDSDAVSIQPQGAFLVEEINVDDLSKQDQEQIRGNLHDDKKINQVLKKTGKSLPDTTKLAKIDDLV